MKPASGLGSCSDTAAGIGSDREADGRWIADIIDLPGVMAYGAAQDEALATVQALAFRVLADKLEHGELTAELHELSFGVEAA